MSVDIDFDANNVPPSTGFDVLPAGEYSVVISESEVKPTKSGNGNYLQLTFTVIEGEYENRKLFARLNIDNPSGQAVAIARSELSAICHAVGVLKLKTSAQLHDIPLSVKVVIQKNKETGEEFNAIKKYNAKNVSPQKPPQNTGGAPKMPWKKS